MPVCMEASTHAGVVRHNDERPHAWAGSASRVLNLISQMHYSTPYLPTQHAVMTTIWLPSLGTLHHTCTRLGGDGGVMSSCRSTRPWLRSLTKQDPETVKTGERYGPEAHAWPWPRLHPVRNATTPALRDLSVCRRIPTTQEKATGGRRRWWRRQNISERATERIVKNRCCCVASPALH